MKIKIFLTSSLILLGVWLAAAFNHTVDLSSYRSAPNKPLDVADTPERSIPSQPDTNAISNAIVTQ